MEGPTCRAITSTEPRSARPCIASGKPRELIALNLGVCKETVANYELGRGIPPIDRLCQLCELLDCAPEDLLRPIPAA